MIAEDLSLFFSDFATTATIGGSSVSAIFDSEFLAAFGLVETAAPMLTARSADVSGASVGDAVTVNSTSYKIASLEPDGTGITVVRLK